MLESNESKRIDYLDSVRGLAALSVLVYHVICSHWDWLKPARIAMMIFNGSDAVAMFFVLSGLVLSLRLIQRDIKISPDYFLKYAFARIFRLYPAFIVMLLVYYFYAHHQENFASLIKETFVSNPYHLFEEAMLIRNHHILFLPDWTLGVEMAISLLVPFMVILAREGNKLFMFFILTILLITISICLNFFTYLDWGF